MTNSDSAAAPSRRKFLKAPGIGAPATVVFLVVIVPGFLNAVFFKLGSLLPLGVKMNILEKLFRVYKTN